MRYFPKIMGDRVYLSPVNTDDAETYVRWMNDPAVAINFGQYPQVVSSTNELNWLFEPPNDIQRYAMILTDGDEMIGCISLQNIDHKNRNAFIGIFIGEAERRNKGYGAEAMRLLLGYAFRTMNLNAVMLSVHEDNIGGITCYKKVGFKEAGRRREWVYKDGQYVDVVYMDILAREF